jgi:hypothetical protein
LLPVWSPARQARDHTHKREIGTDQQIKNVAAQAK